MEQNTTKAEIESAANIVKKTEDVIKTFRYGINIGEQNLLFDKQILCETALDKEIYPIPNLPGWLHGIINLRGNLVPVFAINAFLSGNIQKNKKNIIFVINKGADAIGLLIDKLPVTLEIDTADSAIVMNTYEKTPEIFLGCINTVYKLGPDIWLEIDAKMLIENIHNRSLAKKSLN